MKNKKIILPALLCIALVFSLIAPMLVVGAPTAAYPASKRSVVDDTAVDSPSIASAMALNTSQGYVTPMVAAAFGHHGGP